MTQGALGRSLRDIPLLDGEREIEMTKIFAREALVVFGGVSCLYNPLFVVPHKQNKRTTENLTDCLRLFGDLAESTLVDSIVEKHHRTN